MSPVLETWASARRPSQAWASNRRTAVVINLVKRCRSGNLFRSSIRWWRSSTASKPESHLLPCGGDDRNVIQGRSRLGIADGTENYVPLGQPDVLSNTRRPAKVVSDPRYGDERCVLPGMVLEERQPLIN